MATAAGIIITTGAIQLLNEAVSVPFVPGNTNVLSGINWRLIPATAIAAFIFTGFENVNATAARGIAALALVTSLFISVNGKSVVQSISTALGAPSSSQPVVNLPPGVTFPKGGTPLT